MLPPVIRPAPEDKALPGWPDRALPWAVRGLLLLLMAAIPLTYVIKNARSEGGLQKLILFGKHFDSRLLTEVRALHPYQESEYGYDGQYYAQMAVHPLMQSSEFNLALDCCDYRAQRIALPAMANILGMGKPGRILNAYALLNLVFWLALMAGLAYHLPVASPRDFLCIAAILLGSGSLVCIFRSLTDLPAATLGFFGTVTGEGAAVVFSISILTKPTSLLFLSKYAKLPVRNPGWVGLALKIALILAVPVLWNIYVIHRFGFSNGTSDNLKLPFQSWGQWIPGRWHEFLSVPVAWDWKNGSEWEYRLFNILAPVCLTVQAFHFAVYREWDSPYWRMGAAFAVLYLCFAPASFAEYIAVARCALPLTLAFNLRLRKQRGVTFWAWWLAGNIGLAGALHVMLSYDHFL